MAAHPYTLTPSRRARRDIDEIYRYTLRTYGAKAADDYNQLLRQAYSDISADPFRPGSKERPEIGKNVRSFHISLSKSRAESDVKSPRHFVLYFLPKKDEIVVSRVLHDSRDLARHIPHEDIERAREFKEKRRSQKSRKNKDRGR